MELNQKLAEWAGFKYAPVPDHKWGGEKLAPFDPKGDEISWYPDFTHSLDACFKWLVPKFPDGIILRTLGQKWGGKGFWCALGGKLLAHHFTEAETPAMALCCAIEKLIDEHK